MDLWYPSYQRWQQGARVETLCWKCGRAIWGWRLKLNADGTIFELPGTNQVGLWHAPLPHFRAKSFQAHLAKLDETVSFDVLHCADCEIRAEDGEMLVGIYLAGLWEAHRHALTILNQAKLPLTMTPDWIATMMYEWSGAEPIGPTPPRPIPNHIAEPWRS